jgi:hypothetical protein
MKRASLYDFAVGTLLLTESSLAQAVELRDIRILRDLEQQAASIAGETHADEISIIVDTAMKLDAEFSTFDVSPGRAKYAGSCAFFTANDSFFSSRDIHGWDHADGVYGWSEPLGKPTLEAIALACEHVRVFTHRESVLRIASQLIVLYEGQEASSSTGTLGHATSNPIRSRAQWNETHAENTVTHC